MEATKTCFKCAGTGTPPAYFEARAFNAQGQCALCAGAGRIPKATRFEGPGYVFMPSQLIAYLPPQATLGRCFAPVARVTDQLPHMVDPARVGGIPLGVGAHGPVPGPPLGNPPPGA